MKTQTVSLGKFAGLQLTAEPSAFWAFGLLWLALAALGRFALGLPWLSALAAGLAAAACHWDNELMHHLGHAWAARRTGFPMKGVHFSGFLATSHYPANEPDLPARLHIRRAVGGPIASLLWSAVLGVLALLVPPGRGVIGWVLLFAFLDSLLVIGLGSLLPLPFTDGGTLRHYGRRR